MDEALSSKYSTKNNTSAASNHDKSTSIPKESEHGAAASQQQFGQLTKMSPIKLISYSKLQQPQKFIHWVTFESVLIDKEPAAEVKVDRKQGSRSLGKSRLPSTTRQKHELATDCWSKR